MPVTLYCVSNVMSSPSPTVMLLALRLNSGWYLDTVKLELVMFEKYLPSPSYVAVTLYLAASSLVMLNAATPSVTFA